MKKTVKAKAKKKQSGVKSEATKQKEAARRRAERLLRPSGCREYMRKQLAKEFPGIMSGFVKAAKTGSVPHVKLATELMKPTRVGTPRKKGSVARLLERLQNERREPGGADASLRG
jgi:hypothetical protein